ncbi:MAG: cytochrome c maturation protein CcmE [Alphaproteobacteria bacterium]
MQPKYKRIIIIIIGLLSIVLGIFIILKNFKDNIVFFYTPAEIPQDTHDKIIRVGGIVEEKTIKILEDLKTEFKITDLSKSIKVIYSGFLPSLFREGQGVVAKGKMNGENIFIATEILAKHDEKYMPKEVADKLKKDGKWKE